MTVLPVRSTRVAPDGTVIAPFFPIVVIFPFWTTNAPLSMAALASPTISRAPSYTTAADGLRDCDWTTAIEATEPTSKQQPSSSLNRLMQHLPVPGTEQIRRSYGLHN